MVNQSEVDDIIIDNESVVSVVQKNIALYDKSG
ncbi:MAG: hypothetical protein MZU84_07520 [Sphingobacterium sp.]|nr:hypothetical protein [Sphingobacterium sp.]